MWHRDLSWTTPDRVWIWLAQFQLHHLLATGTIFLNRCVPKPSGQCVQKSPLCSAHLLDSPNPIQWPMWFCAFFFDAQETSEKKTSGKPLSNCHPSKTYTSCTVHHFWHSSYIFHPPNKKNLLKMAQTFRLLPFLLRVWHLWSTESWASCISAEPHEVTAIGFVGVFTTLFPTKIHNSCLGSNS